MLYKKEILEIINKIVYKDTQTIDFLERRICLETDDDLLLNLRDICIRVSIIGRTFCIEEIKLSNKIKGQKVCFNLIGEFINFAKISSYFKAIKCCCIISPKVSSICDYYNMEEIDEPIYGVYDDYYDYEGTFGSRILYFNKV